MGIFRKINNRRHLNKRSHRTFFSIILVDTEYPKVLLTSMIEITSRFAIILVKYSKFNKRRHPNKSIGMGKIFKINKRRAYVYSELKSTYISIIKLTDLGKVNDIQDEKMNA